MGVYLLGLGGLSDIHLGTPPFPPLLLTSFYSEQQALVSLALESPTPGFPTDCVPSAWSPSILVFGYQLKCHLSGPSVFLLPLRTIAV